MVNPERSIWHDLDPELNVLLAELADEGRALFQQFDLVVRRRRFHPFVPADYDKVLRELLVLRQPGARFLELGSGNGVITIMADLLGFEAYGIELDAQLVEVSRELAARYDSRATFAAGSFLPDDYEYSSGHGDDRTGTIGTGRSGYAALGLDLADFDLVYGYAWPGEADVMLHLLRTRGRGDARLLLNTAAGDIGVYPSDRIPRE
jgi:SAM-dependent methyltransferase